jgi:hypothetical protein
LEAKLRPDWKPSIRSQLPMAAAVIQATEWTVIQDKGGSLRGRA